ncbi:Polysaccharide biosynthesis protein [gamma proteobacterium HdN1]|nr:Polysaccharide biosynthesis protein [gamma proteobacterium HdN1]
MIKTFPANFAPFALFARGDLLVSKSQPTASTFFRAILCGALAVCFLAGAGQSRAITPSPAQIEQFRKLPLEQQRALAKQYGIDLDSLAGVGQASGPIGETDAVSGVNTPSASGAAAPSQATTLRVPPAPPQSGQSTRFGVRKVSYVSCEPHGLWGAPMLRTTRTGNVLGGEAGRSSAASMDVLEQPIDTADDDSQISDKRNCSPDNLASLQPFGYDLFSGSTLTFAPLANMPVPLDYVLGPGDTLVVQLYGKTNTNQEMVVDRDGAIQFPELGPITVAGLRFEEVRAQILSAVSEKMIGVNGSVTMGALRSMQVLVLGEVVNPGTYVISSMSSITHALLAGGGISEIGSLRNIQLKRRGQLISTLDLYDLLLKGDTQHDTRLQPGDVVFVPPAGKRVGIGGEVRRPAIYEVKGAANMADLVKLAGGLLPTAYPTATRVDRINAKSEHTLLEVDLNARKGQTLLVRDGDVIDVQPVLDDLKGIVQVSGYVNRPGGVAWHPGMRVTEAIRGFYDLQADPDLEYALIKRRVLPARTIVVERLHLGDALRAPGSRADLVLRAEDEILVFPRAGEAREAMIKPLLGVLQSQADGNKPAQIVSVSGNVRVPGEYPLTEGMTPQDLVTAAGGMLESAYGVEAEITRALVDANEYQKTQRIPVSFSGEIPSGGASAHILLAAHDQLYIKRIPGWNEREYAEIDGEVNFPGRYPIFRGDTVGMLIARAGGLTKYADPNSTIFLRENLRRREEQQLAKFQKKLEADVAKMKLEAAKSKATSGDVERIGSSLLADLSTAQASGRLVIDVAAILNKKPNSDVTLQSGDRLVLPIKPQEVSVIGEVQFPTSHLYKQGLDVQDYINISGGFTSKSDEKHVYVIAANGQVRAVKKGVFSLKGELGAGDTVVVPYDVESVSNMQYWLNTSQILFQLSTTAAALKTVGVF